MESFGGAPFMDGDWESICGILSFDQDFGLSNSISHNIPHSVNGSLFGLLLGNANPFICPTQSSCSDVSNGSLANLNGAFCQQFVHPCCNEDDQLSALSSSNSPPLGFLANANQSTKRNHDRLQIQAESPLSKKRKMLTRKTKREQKPSYESSDNESNPSQEVINEEAKETHDSNGKKKVNRGSATDPQSLYARKRRERINERLRTLQTLVPNGTKVDISTMLEEAVNYVKFLQLQIKLLSSDEMWMYAPLAYNGFDGDIYKSFSPHFLSP